MKWEIPRGLTLSKQKLHQSSLNTMVARWMSPADGQGIYKQILER
jgi:hypothetical protein